MNKKIVSGIVGLAVITGIVALTGPVQASERVFFGFPRGDFGGAIVTQFPRDAFGRAFILDDRFNPNRGPSDQFLFADPRDLRFFGFANDARFDRDNRFIFFNDRFDLDDDFDFEDRFDFDDDFDDDFDFDDRFDSRGHQ